jgi:hypothetical protein
LSRPCLLVRRNPQVAVGNDKCWLLHLSCPL